MAGILICGANGSGKTVLGRALAERLRCRHLDIEDYAFAPSPIPYAKPRERDDMRRLLLADMRQSGDFVLSAVSGDLGREIAALYTCAVYLSAPADLRIARIRQRSREQFGARALPGGDLFAREQRFLAFAAARSMDETQAWLKSLSCPVIRADGTRPVAQNAAWLAGEILKQR